jgi:hypothetical protein
MKFKERETITIWNISDEHDLASLVVGSWRHCDDLVFVCDLDCCRRDKELSMFESRNRCDQSR